ncbi:MAG: hypothetical protein ACT4QD_27225 [Acidobacteriota bacterium]
MTFPTRLVPTIAIGLFFAVPTRSVAGPPLICQPFQTGSAAVLPWGDGPGWNTPDHGYRLEDLTTDVIALLSPKAPVIARMENLRRATIYAARDARVAGALLSAVLARVPSPESTGLPDPAALFDAGYLIETYHQAATLNHGSIGQALRHSGRWSAKLDGYALIARAMALTEANAEMEFAASLIKTGAASDVHRRRALARAQPGSLLAMNLAR